MKSLPRLRIGSDSCGLLMFLSKTERREDNDNTRDKCVPRQNPVENSACRNREKDNHYTENRAEGSIENLESLGVLIAAFFWVIEYCHQAPGEEECTENPYVGNSSENRIDEERHAQHDRENAENNAHYPFPAFPDSKDTGHDGRKTEGDDKRSQSEEKESKREAGPKYRDQTQQHEEDSFR